MTNEEMWKNSDPVAELGIDVPSWIDPDISPYDIAAIVQGGCASGAYTPAVTYHQAKHVMDGWGNDVLDYIQEVMGELPQPRQDESWAGRACFFLSRAVELWASGVESELESMDLDDVG